jgi:simple sugar transport system permease protein
VGNLLTDNAYLGIAAVGMTVVILSGDRPLGRLVIAFAGCSSPLCSATRASPDSVFVMLLAITTAFGAAQGALIHGLAMPPSL